MPVNLERYARSLASLVLAAILLMTMLVPASSFAAPISLPRYNVDKSQTSVSGLSAGAYMAVQMHVAYSSIMKGAGVFAGGPYLCAEGDINIALSRCMSPNALHPAPTPGDIARFAQRTRDRAAAGMIDDPANLAGQRAWIFVGTSDDVVVPAVVDTLSAYYGRFMPSANIFYKHDIVTFHNLVVLDGDNRIQSCNHKNQSNNHESFINDCDYDAAGALLQHIYGPLHPRNTGTLSGQFIEFDQHEFIANPRSKSMDDTGWAYVPASCAGGAACKLHIAFHGCYQFTEWINDAFIKNSGLNQWADTNNIIVLYPQTVAVDNGPLNIPFNPRGCFDWWGYNESGSASSKIYDTRQGVQMAAVKSMIDRIAGDGAGPEPGPAAPTALTVTGTTDSAVSLAWSASAGPDLAGYNVYRNGSKVNPGLVNSTNYVDSGLLSGTTYAYAIKAVNARNVESAPSNTISATTGGAAAHDFTSDSTQDGYVKAYADGSSPAVGFFSSLAIGRGTDRKFNRALLSFDTSQIPPGATITRAYLTVTHEGRYGTPWDSPAGNSLVIDVKSGVFGAAATTETADWAAPATAHAVASIPKFAAGSQRSDDFNAAGLAAISKGGGARTQLRLKFSANQTAANYVRLLDGTGAILTVVYH